MTENENMVNIGTSERPEFVPRKALEPQTPEGKSWWGKVADGSVVVEDGVLDKLIEKINKDDEKG